MVLCYLEPYRNSDTKECHKFRSVNIQRNCIVAILPHLHLYYLETSIVCTIQISHVACSLMTIMKFALDESTRRESKGYYSPVGGLFILLMITTTWLLDDKAFLQSGE